MISKPTQALADAAGTMDSALAYIADELHTALVDLDRTATLDEPPTAETRDRLERLGAYVADVQARTAPTVHPAPGPFSREGIYLDNLEQPYDPPGWKRARLAIGIPTDADLGFEPGQAGPVE